ncbi:winged helix-turn-helix domain-containing protein [Nocardia zapadnayensis]|uniref:BTAD domain-containing putative transcriptional regulator n=1 Tax=Nocardia rhamnosiphila TaxID=426716 RepID=UPI0022455B05|nr:BTAD domain-containing putative transcriptional regulator [Nocardia zapadnayensis]MCX0269646.1 winged helix-turn-helix domain-containing protein [Nocardia zapadnayensis]
MRIEVLGPLRVVADDRSVRVGGVRARALLIRLALQAGRVVSARTLVESVWPENIPDHPDSALHSLVARLRRALPEPVISLSGTAGYLLDIPADAVDALRFERLAEEGRQALGAGRHGAADELLTEALGLWRGEPLTDIAHLPFAVAAGVRLDDLRLEATEDRIEAMLSGSSPARALLSVELNQLIADNPLRERLRGLLIRALVANGRQTEALAVYEDYRSLLAEQLGTDPGPELRALHIRILRGDTERSPVDGNLRAPLTSFVGREADRRQVVRRLLDNRLLTLVGPGGVGKTRLATTVGTGLDIPVWLVELAPVTHPGDVPRAVVAALGLRDSADAVSRLVDTLKHRETAVILDGCEHVVDAAAQLAAELLGRCPRLRILATSREPLGITGEALFPVAPLDVGPAAKLFTDRARSVRPEFVPSDDIDRICRRLDCLPLAIELAAVRLRSMSMETLAARLDDRFQLLTSGSRTSPSRHRTLRAVVEWSWDLLPDTERAAADQAAVFPGSFSGEAAEHTGITADVLHALVDKSLLEYEAGRYRMLDTIREFGIEQLGATGRMAAARTGHAAYFLELAERAEPQLRGSGQLPWLTCLDAEQDNMNAALRFAVSRGDTDTAVRLGAALGQFWTIHGDHARATAQLHEVLSMTGPAAAGARLRATAAYLLNATFAGSLGTAAATVQRPDAAHEPTAAFICGLLALATGRTDDGLATLEPHLQHPDPWTRGMLWFARSLLDGAAGRGDSGRFDITAAVEGFRGCGERWALSLSLMSLASALITAGDTVEGLTTLNEAVQLSRELGTHDGQRAWLAMVRIDAGDIDTARRQLAEILTRGGAPHEIVLARISLADLARHTGDLDEAKRHLGYAADTTDPPEHALYSAGAGYLAAATGDFTTAARYLSEARDIAVGLPDMPMLAHVAVGMADLAHRRGEPDRASEILGVAHALRGGPNSGNPDVARLTDALGGYRNEYERGRGLAPVIALAEIQAY